MDDIASGVGPIHSLFGLAFSGEAGARPRTLAPSPMIESTTDLARSPLQPPSTPFLLRRFNRSA